MVRNAVLLAIAVQVSACGSPSADSPQSAAAPPPLKQSGEIAPAHSDVYEDVAFDADELRWLLEQDALAKGGDIGAIRSLSNFFLMKTDRRDIAIRWLREGAMRDDVPSLVNLSTALQAEGTAVACKESEASLIRAIELAKGNAAQAEHLSQRLHDRRNAPASLEGCNYGPAQK